MTRLWSDEMAFLAVPMSAVYGVLGCYAMHVPLFGQACWLPATWGQAQGFILCHFRKGILCWFTVQHS